MKFEIVYDKLFYPYYIYRELTDEQSKYYNHKWFLLIHILFWEITIYKVV